MIRHFQHKGLERFFVKSDCSRIDAKQADRIQRVLDRLDAAAKPEDLNLPGYKFHGLGGQRNGAFAVSVSSNCSISFRFEDDDAIEVNLEDYL